MFSRHEKLVLFTLALVQFSHIVDFMIVMPLGPQLMRIFSIDPHQFGILVSCYTFAAGATGILSAFFMDRFDRKNSLLFFYLGFTVGTIACAFAPNYEFLLAARTFTGAFGGVLSALSFAITGDVVSPDRRGLAMGIVMGAFSLASIFGVPFSLYLANLYGWHTPFLFVGGIACFLILVIIKLVPPVREHLDKPSGENPWHVVIGILQNSSTRFSLLFMMLLTLGQFSLIPFISPSLVANAKLPESHLPLMYMVGGICSLIAAPLVGRLSDRIGKKKVFYVAVLLSLFPFYWITHLGPGPEWLTLAVSGSFFIVTTSRTIPAMAMVTSSIHPQRRGSFMSLNSSVQQFSGALGSLLSGLIVIRATTGELMNYDKVGLAGIALSVVAMLTATKIKLVE